MLSYVNRKWSERESWLKNTGTEQESDETVSTRTTRRRSSSVPQPITVLWDPLLKREFKSCFMETERIHRF